MKKIRHIIAERLFAPKKCCSGQSDRAVIFKRSVLSSSLSNKLDANRSAKAAQFLGQSLGSSPGAKKQTYSDTDNRKRDFGGDMPPGRDGSGGLIYDVHATGEDPDVVFRPFVSPINRRMNEHRKSVNAGWIKKKKDEPNTPLSQQPQIILKKYKVNPKTDDIIPSSEKIINPFSTFSGNEFSEDQIPNPINTKRIDSFIEKKMLPGRSLASRIPGGSLLGRAAAAIGIIRDANNKFRCPPGTPAANQFTDMRGTTCFDVNPGQIAKFINDKAVELTDAGEMQGFARFARRASRWLQTGSWDDNQGISDLPVNRPVSYMIPGSRAPGFDPITGRSSAPDWEDVDVPADMRVFKNTMINSQKRLKQAKETVRNLQEALGVDTSSTAMATNEDLAQTFQKLRETGQWNVEIQRLSPDEVEAMVRERIEAIDSVRDVPLTPEQKEKLVKADIQRYYVTERALMETNLEQFTRMPEHMKKVGRLKFGKYEGPEKDRDEGGAEYIKLDSGAISVIDFNIDTIMSNQEKKLPNLGVNERLLITAVGGKTDIERDMAVADFISVADIHANHMAGLANGIEGMARHIALHEIGHTIQAQAFIDAINESIRENGHFEWKGKKYNKISKIPLLEVMMEANPSVTDPDAAEQLAELRNVWGSYPAGSRNYVLEAQTELWALREGGFIQGEDIDNVLGYMDNYTDARRIAERTKVSETYIKDLKEGKIKPRSGGGGGMVDGIDPDLAPTEAVPKSIGHASVEERRRALTELNKELKELEIPEEELIKFAGRYELMSGIAETVIEEKSSIITKIAKEISDKSATKRKFVGSKEEAALLEKLNFEKTELEAAQNAKEFYDEGYRRIRREWKKKFGIGTREETSRFDERVRKAREEAGMLTPSESLAVEAEARKEYLKESIKDLSMDALVNEITAMEAKYTAGKFDSPEELIQLDEKHELFVNEYIDRQIELGDTRTRKQIQKELINRIEEKISPKPKPKKKFKSKKDTKDYAMSERKKLRKKITKEQAEAVRALENFDDKEVVKILKPENNSSSGRAMNRARERLRRLGLEHDPRSTSDGSMEEQVENLLVPALEVMEISSVSEPFDVEVVLDVDPGELTGKSIGKEFDHKGTLNGKVIGKGHKPTKVSSKTDPKTKKRQRRVVISLKEGDRGIFPTAKGDETQSFVMPPGKLKIVGRDPDGTIRVEISYQKGTTEVLDDLASDIANGSGDAIWRKSASRKIKAISDRRVIEKPERLSSGRSNDKNETRRTSKDIMSSLGKTNSSFGRSFPDGENKKRTSPKTETSTDGGLFTPLKMVEMELLEYERTGNITGPGIGGGRMPLPTRQLEQRLRELRKDYKKMTGYDWDDRPEKSGPSFREQIESSINEIFDDKKPKTKKIVDSADDYESIINSEVKKILEKTPKAELQKKIEYEAVKFHIGLDKRPRVRMRESELDNFAKTGKIRASRDSGKSVVGGVSRRAERLSSGAQPMSRGEREQEFAKRVRERIEDKLSKIPPLEIPDGLSDKERSQAVRNHVNNWFDGLSDVELESMGITRRYNEDGSPYVSKTTGRVIYKTENNEVAAALLSLGQTAEMPEHKRGESMMVKQASKQIGKELKELAANSKDILVTADLCKFYLEGKNVFCKKNLKVDRNEMPQVGGRSIDNNSMALRIWASGLATAETAQAHKLGEDSQYVGSLKNKVKQLKESGDIKAAEELENEIKVLETIGMGFEGAGIEQKDLLVDENVIKINKKLSMSAKEVKEIMKKHNVEITGRELKRLGEKWNRAATARMNGKEPNKEDLFTPQEEKNFFEHLDYSMLEPDGVDAFTDFLKMLGVEIAEDRITKPEEMMASQRELDATKVDAIGENIVDAIKRLVAIPDAAERKAEINRLRQESGLFKKILISKEGYIVDGHHRIIGKVVANGVVTEDIAGISQDDLDVLGLPVRQVDMGIIELLTISRVYQDFLGIKPASLAKNAEESYKSDLFGIEKIPKISKENFEAAQVKLLYELQDKTDEIYDAGTFIQVDSIGLNDTEESLIYKASELRRQKQASARARARRERQGQNEKERLSSGLAMPVMFGAATVINSQGRSGGTSPDVQRVITDRRYRAQTSMKNELREISSLKNLLKSVKNGREQNDIQSRITHLENMVDAFKSEANLNRLRGVLNDKKNRKTYEKIAKSVNKENIDTNTKEAINNLIKAMIEAEEFGELDYAGVADAIDSLSKNGMNSAASRAIFELEKHNLVSKKQLDGLQYLLDKENPNKNRRTPRTSVDSSRQTVDPLDTIRNVPTPTTFLAETLTRNNTVDFRTDRENKEQQAYEATSSAFKKLNDKIAFGKSKEETRLSSGSTRRDKLNKKGMIDKFVFNKMKVGNEARNIKLDTDSISKPEKIENDEFFKIVGEVPGVFDSDKLTATEKLTSSRVDGLEMYRATYEGKRGTKNRVFGKYKSPNGKTFTIAQDEDGFEGMYYAYPGDKRLPESQRIGKLTLILNDGEMNVHDLFNIHINKENRKDGLAQAMAEVAKADFPESTFTVSRVVTNDGARFAQNLTNSRTVGKNKNNESRLSSGAISKINKAVKDTNIDKESREKIMFALQNIPTYKKGSTKAELDDFVKQVNKISGSEIAKLTVSQMEEFGLINRYEKNNIGINLSKNEYENQNQKLSALKNAFLDGAEAMADVWSPEASDNGRRTSGSAYKGRTGNIDETDIEYDEEDSSISSLRKEIWKNNGLSEDIDEDMLPVSGYMVHDSQIKQKRKNAIENGAAGIDENAIFEMQDNDIIGSGLTAQGEIEVVLKPEVAERTAYNKGNMIKNGGKPVLVNSSSREDIIRAISEDKNGINKESILNLLGSSIDGNITGITSKKPKGKEYRPMNKPIPDDFEYEQIQAHILGGFDKEDVESISYPFSKLEKISKNEKIDDVVNEKSIADILRKAGFTDEEINYFYSMSNGKPINTQSMQALKNYRAAQKIKEKYKNQGFDKVNFAHPMGFNIENPKTYNMSADKQKSVEDVLKNNIGKEIAEEAKKVLREMKKNGAPFFSVMKNTKEKG